MEADVVELDADDDEDTPEEHAEGPAPHSRDTTLNAPLVSGSMAAVAIKHPDRKHVHEAIQKVKHLGYLLPIERYTLIQNIIQVVKASNYIDGDGSDDLALIKAVFIEVQETEEAADTVKSFQGHKSTWINNGTKSRQIAMGSEIPDGWKLGRIMTPRMVEHLKRITAAAAIINRNSLGNAHGSRWYTNGDLNIQVRPGVTPPPGFILGRHFTIEQKKKLAKNLGDHAIKAEKRG
jgi:hypothetical protein